MMLSTFDFKVFPETDDNNNISFSMKFNSLEHISPKFVMCSVRRKTTPSAVEVPNDNAFDFSKKTKT